MKVTTNRSDEATKAELKALSAFIFNLRSSWIASGMLFKKTRGYSIRPNLNLYYIDDPNFVYSIPVEHREEEVWSAHDVHQLISDEILASNQFASVVSSLQIQEHEKQILRAFSYSIALQSRFRDEPFSEDALIDIATADLLGVEKQYRIVIYLSGIALQGETVSINDAVVLRKPTREDVIENIPDDALHYAHALTNQVHFSCICEANYRSVEPYRLQRWTNQLLNALAFFQLGSVFSQRMTFVSRSFSMMSTFSLGGSVSYAQRKKYNLAASDAPMLNEFIASNLEHFPTALNPDDEPVYLSTALAWYQDALQSSSKPLEGVIASSIACLEALFLHDTKNEEIAYRLKQRVSLLLGRFGLSSQRVRAILTDAYEVRSRYVHGGKRDTKYKKRFTQQKIVELYDQTAEIARLSFLIHFQFKKFSLHQEKELYRLLEDAAIDDRARILLDEVCKKVAFISTDKIPKVAESSIPEGEEESANCV